MTAACRYINGLEINFITRKEKIQCNALEKSSYVQEYSK